MQALSLASTDMMTAGSATGASSAKAGQKEAGFTGHLAKAAAKQSSSHKQTGSSAKANEEPVNEASQANIVNVAASMTKDTDGSTSDMAEDDSNAAALTSATVYPAEIFFQWTAAQAANATTPAVNQLHKAATAIDRILSAVTLPGASKSIDMAALPGKGQTPVAADSKQASLLDTTAAQTPGAVPGEVPTAAPEPVAPQTLTALSFLSADLATTTMATTAITGKGVEQSTTLSMTAGEALAGTGALASTQVMSSPTSAIQQNGAEQGLGQIVQNEYSQTITIHQAAKAEEIADTPTVSEKSAASTTGGDSRLDVNNSYVHSRLPGESQMASKDGDKGEQKETGGEQQKNTPAPEAATSGQTQADQLVSQKNQVTLNQESQPLIFAHHRDAASAFASGSTSTTTSTDSSSLLRLQSGLAVPEGTVIDQMITRFTMNQRLESGSVNLRLYPQELGELRMEIKVEQDNIKAHIIAQNPQAQEMIDRHLPRLREALEQQGLHLQHVEVTVATSDNTSDQRFQDNSRHEQLHQSKQSNLFQPAFTLESIEPLAETESTTSNLNVLA